MDAQVFRALMDHLNDAVEVIDAATGRYVDVNLRACSDLGYDREELLSLSISDVEMQFKNNTDWAGAAEQMRNMPSQLHEGMHRKKDGSTFPVEVSITFLEATDGDYVLAVCRDITERRRMEAELKNAIETAEAANRAKSDFLATMSHELRTPLTMILGPLESLLAGQPLDERVNVPRRDLERVSRNAARLKGIVDDILDYSKGNAGQLGIDLQPVEFDETLVDMVESIRPAAEALGIDLVLGTSQPEVGRVSLDLKKIDKVILNLIGNALKFTEEGGTITVSTHVHGGKFEISVKDTGIGIPKDKLPILFRRFQQVDASTTRKYGGTGLGLALVKQFAELHGGSVAVESEYGSGSCFTVTLPRRIVDDEQVEATPNRPSLPRSDGQFARQLEHASRGRTTNVKPRQNDVTPAKVQTAPQLAVSADSPQHRPRIVLAEDTRDMREYITEQLESHYEVAAFENGALALEAILESAPDVIVSDVMMPEMDGMELARTLKSNADTATIPVILLTARGSADAVTEGLGSGADDYLGKPFNPAELLARVESAHRLRRAHLHAIEKTRELADIRLALAESEKLSGLGRMLAQLSHELNNPINVIQNNIDPIRDYQRAIFQMLGELRMAIDGLEGADPLVDRWRELDIDFAISDLPDALNTVSSAVARIVAIQAALKPLIRDDLGQLETGDLNAIVREQIAALEPNIPKSVQLIAEYGDLPDVDFCAQQIRHVFENLFINAMEWVGDNGQIVCRSYALAGRERVRIEIEDDGPGVPDSLRARIFEPFFTTKDVRRGPGLGLAICRKIITEHHAGHISVESRTDGGARFVIELPRRSVSPGSEPEPAASIHQISGRGA